MIQRDLEHSILALSEQYPVVAVLGPRQSGKTTLVRSLFSNYTYVSLEDIDVRRRAQYDPRGFLHQGDHTGGLILDEIQNAPELLSYIQTIVDEPDRTTSFIITGSQNILVHEAISQTLAGRVALFTLLPLSLHELKHVPSLTPTSADQAIFYGGYPRIYAHQISPKNWYPDYIATYLERDVRQVKNILNLDSFQHFVLLCAGRIGQILNLTSLANDCGVSVPTISSWLSLLQATYLVYLMQPYYKNFSRRLIKSPKLYFYDTGLACSLLNIQAPEQLFNHYLRGNLFENFVVTELLKSFYNSKQSPRIYFWRDQAGHEVDVIIEKGTELYALEVKASATASYNAFDNIKFLSKITENTQLHQRVVYAGDHNQLWGDYEFVSWQSIDGIMTNK